jgi:hypothetical protein
MSGNNETGRILVEIPPTRTVRMEITIATIGRLTKNLDITVKRGRGCGFAFWGRVGGWDLWDSWDLWVGKRLLFTAVLTPNECG